MFDLTLWFTGLGVIAAMAVLTWGLSVIVSDASIVDSLWSLLSVGAGVTYFLGSDAEPGAAAKVSLVLLVLWGVRLSGYITIRNWGHGEDPRYQSMRKRQGPNFAVKSLVTVFLFQGLIAWIVSTPLIYAVGGEGDIGIVGLLGAAVWLVGFSFEAGGDAQLSRFKADPANAGKVMDRGFWRYTRHPNYFGDSAQWWGLWLLAAASGGWWTAFGPAVMTFMLLRVSGVALLERRMARTRPEYQEYVSRTNAFLPGPPKRA